MRCSNVLQLGARTKSDLENGQQNMLRLSEAQGSKQRPFPRPCLQETCVRSELQSSSAVAKSIAWRQHVTPGCVQSEKTYRRKIRYGDFWRQVFICQGQRKAGLVEPIATVSLPSCQRKIACSHRRGLTFHVFQDAVCFSLTKMLRLG